MIKTLKRLLIFILVVFTLFFSLSFYFSNSQASIEKPVIGYKQIKEFTTYFDEIKERPHLNGQTYHITFSELQLNEAFTFFQNLKNQKSTSKIVLNENSIDIYIEQAFKMVVDRYLPVKSTILINEYSTPVQSIELKNKALPEFILNIANNKFVENIESQELAQLLTTENINVSIQENNLVISYTWSDLFSQKFEQPDLESSKKIQAAYLALQNNLKNDLKNTDQFKVSLQDAMVELLSYFNELHTSDERLIFWSVLFASVDSNRAEEYLNIKFSKPLVKLTLQNRYDLAKHFVFSAYLQQIGGNSFSSIIGEYKENKDATTRLTKFSYSDVMANQAGIYFSQVLVSKIESGQLEEFTQRLKTNRLSLNDELFEDGIDAPSKEMQDKTIESIKAQLSELKIYQ